MATAVTTKESALLVRCLKRPLLATLHTQNQTLHVVEVCVKGGHKYALGEKRTAGYRWIIGPTDKNELWEAMKERWNVTVAN